ncbi:hypothetical protein D3C75_730670 [compost metagenome]
MPQRLALQMVLQAGDIRFRRHLRHIQARFSDADGANVFRQVVHDNAVGAFNTFAGITVFHLLAGYIQRIAFDLDIRVGQPRVVFKLCELIGDHRRLENFILRLRLVLRATIVVIARSQIVEVGPQRHAKHEGVAAFVADVNVGPIGDTIDSADVNVATLLEFPGKILGVIIAFIFHFQAQRLPWSLVFNAAKQRRRAVEHAAKVERTRLVVAVITIAITVADFAEWVFHVTAGAHVAPAHSEGKVERPPGFARHNIFTVEQPGAA